MKTKVFGFQIKVAGGAEISFAFKTELVRDARMKFVVRRLAALLGEEHIQCRRFHAYQAPKLAIVRGRKK